MLEKTYLKAFFAVVLCAGMISCICRDDTEEEDTEREAQRRKEYKQVSKCLLKYLCDCGEDAFLTLEDAWMKQGNKSKQYFLMLAQNGVFCPELKSLEGLDTEDLENVLCPLDREDAVECLTNLLLCRMKYVEKMKDEDSEEVLTILKAEEDLKFIVRQCVKYGDDCP